MFNTSTKDRDIERFYVKVPIELLNDHTLSNNAKIMLQHIMSDSDNFVLYLRNLANRMNISYRTAQRYMNELEQSEYVYKKRIKGIWEYHVFFKKLIPDKIIRTD